MSLFKPTQKNILGVDLGSSSIKVVELKEGEQGVELVTYGYAKFKIDDVKKDAAKEQERTAAILKKVCEKAKITSVNVIASLPPFFVFSSIINLPQMPKQDIEAAVRWEAKKVIPLPLEQIELKWKLIDVKKGPIPQQQQQSTDDKKDQKMQILLTGAAKKIVQKYMYVFKKAGLNLYSLETESFALSRSLLGENERAVVMIVDIGSLNTNIAIIKSGIPFINKSIDVGSFTISKIIANSLNINFDRAEQFQYDIGVSLEKKNEGESIPKIIEDSLSPIINEIKYSFSLYEEYKNSVLNPEDKIEKIILCGGGVMIPNLTEYLSETLGIKVYRGNPWAHVNFPDDLKLILDEVGPNFAVAIGLAMRDLA